MTEPEKTMEEQSLEAFRNGDSIPLQQRILELRVKVLQKQVQQLQSSLEIAQKSQRALELLDKGPVLSVSALEYGGYNITVKSGIASVSATIEGLPIADAIMSASNVATA